MEFLTDLAGTSGIDIAIKSFLLIPVVLGVCFIVRNRPAVVRHYAITIVFFLLLLMPFSSALPGWRLDVLSTITSEARAVAVENTKAPIFIEDAAASQISLTNVANQLPTTGFQKLLPIAALVYLAITAFFFGRLLFGIGRTILKVRSGIPVGPALLEIQRQVCREMSLTENISVRRGFGVDVPMTFGFVRPSVFLPITSESWSVERARRVFQHELAHVARRDCQAKLLGRVVCAIYWFNPLVWLLFRKMELNAELACDDMVIAAGAKKSDYADDLMFFSVVQYRTAYCDASASILVDSNDLEKRMCHVLGSHKRAVKFGFARKFGMACTLLCAAVPFGAVKFSRNVIAYADLAVPNLAEITRFDNGNLMIPVAVSRERKIKEPIAQKTEVVLRPVQALKTSSNPGGLQSDNRLQRPDEGNEISMHRSHPAGPAMDSRSNVVGYNYRYVKSTQTVERQTTKTETSTRESRETTNSTIK